MTAKNELMQYRELLRPVNCISEKIQTLESRVNSCTYSYNPMAGRSGDQSGTKEDLIGNLVELREQYYIKATTAEKHQLTLFRKIIKIDDSLSRRILHRYFFDSLTLEQVAKKEEYSSKHIILLFKNALSKYYITNIAP